MHSPMLRIVAAAAALLIAGLGSLALVQGQDADQQNAQVQQYVQMMQPALWRELDFIRRVCDLTPPQRSKIKAAGDAAVTKAAKSVVQPQVQPRINPTSAANIIRDGLNEELKKTLTAEQLQHFTAEAEKRAAATKEATILGAVSQIDTGLYLTAEQREKIVASLEKNWQREWEQWLVIQQYAGQYYPQVPDQHVTPHLTPDQTNVWRGLQKVMIYHWGNHARRPEDEAWWQEGGEAKANTKNNIKANATKPALIYPARKGGAAIAPPAAKAAEREPAKADK